MSVNKAAAEQTIKPFSREVAPMERYEKGLIITVIALAIIGIVALRVYGSLPLAIVSFSFAGWLALNEVGIRGYAHFKKKSATEKMQQQLNYAIQEGVKGDEKPKGFWGVGQSYQPDDQICADPPTYDCSLSLVVGSAETQELRQEMEDVHFACDVSLRLADKRKVQAGLIAVCDGHKDGGAIGALLKNSLPKALESELKALDDDSIANALTKCIVEFDRREDLRGIEGGTTLTGALIFEDQIFIFNVGDSRTILCKTGGLDTRGYQLTEDAKPLHPRFKRRLEKDGYNVFNDRNGGRVLIQQSRNNIGVARDLGIEELSACPKIAHIVRKSPAEAAPSSIYCSEGDYLVLACDGLWDVATNQEVAQAIKQMEQDGKNPSEIAALLAARALHNNSTDNISVVVVKSR